MRSFVIFNFKTLYVDIKHIRVLKVKKHIQYFKTLYVDIKRLQKDSFLWYTGISKHYMLILNKYYQIYDTYNKLFQNIIC